MHSEPSLFHLTSSFSHRNRAEAHARGRAQCRQGGGDDARQHLQAYCDMAPHIHCLNPASKTGKKTDGERWQKREGNGSFKTIYYVLSKRQFQSESTHTEPEEQTILF